MAGNRLAVSAVVSRLGKDRCPFWLTRGGPWDKRQIAESPNPFRPGLESERRSSSLSKYGCTFYGSVLVVRMTTYLESAPNGTWAWLPTVTPGNHHPPTPPPPNDFGHRSRPVRVNGWPLRDDNNSTYSCTVPCTRSVWPCPPGRRLRADGTRSGTSGRPSRTPTGTATCLADSMWHT